MCQLVECGSRANLTCAQCLKVINECIPSSPPDHNRPNRHDHHAVDEGRRTTTPSYATSPSSRDNSLDAMAEPPSSKESSAPPPPHPTIAKRPPRPDLVTTLTSADESVLSLVVDETNGFIFGASQDGGIHVRPSQAQVLTSPSS